MFKYIFIIFSSGIWTDLDRRANIILNDQQDCEHWKDFVEQIETF